VKWLLDDYQGEICLAPWVVLLAYMTQDSDDENYGLLWHSTFEFCGGESNLPRDPIELYRITALLTRLFAAVTFDSKVGGVCQGIGCRCYTTSLCSLIQDMSMRRMVILCSVCCIDNYLTVSLPWSCRYSLSISFPQNKASLCGELGTDYDDFSSATSSDVFVLLSIQDGDPVVVCDVHFPGSSMGHCHDIDRPSQSGATSWIMDTPKPPKPGWCVGQ
jgi:hypothetical protein